MSAQETISEQAFVEQGIFINEINEGLSQGMVNALVEDPDGYIWVGTKDGLNKFDGEHFNVYREEKYEPNSLSDNFINSLLVDSEGYLWVGTQTAGLNLFQHSSDSFIRFLHKEGDSTAISSDFIGELFEDTYGNIIIQTLDEYGFSVLKTAHCRGKTPPDTTIQAAPIEEVYPVFSDMHRSGSHSRHLFFDRFNGLWYVNNDSVFYSPEEYLQTDEVPFIFSLSNCESEFVDYEYSIVSSKDRSRILITDRVRKLYEFNFRTRTFDEVFTLPEGFVFRHRQFLDSQGAFWSWTEDGRALRIDVIDSVLTVLIPNWERLQPESKKMHTGILTEDHNGNFWLGTGGNGMLKIIGGSSRFKRPLSIDESLVDALRTFRVERPGGVGFFELETAKSAGSILRKVMSLGSYKVAREITHLTLDSRGNFWMRAYHEGKDSVSVGFYNPKVPEKFNHVIRRPFDNSQLFGNPIFLDKEENVWFGERYFNGEVHLYKYERLTDSLHTFRFPTLGQKFQYRFISDWQYDSDDRLWMATMHGVFRFDERNQSWLHIAEEGADINGLSENQTLSICLDPRQPERFVWVGTEGGGLNKIDLKLKSVTSRSTEDGLPNDVVYGIMPDDRGNLWFGTNKGLCLQNAENGSIRVFTADDGLPSNEFNRYEYCKSDRGELCFGSMGGLVCFDPDEFYSQGAGSKTVITSLFLFNELVQFRNKDRLLQSKVDLKKPISLTDTLILEHFHDMVTFRFAHLDLTAPAKNKFKYRLRGLSEQWIETEGRNEATFTNLDKGTYTLEVLGQGSDFKWDIQPTTMCLIVKGAWWSSSWFVLLLIIAGVSILFGVYQIRIRNMLKFEKMRNRIAQDLHDEIGSTLSSISLYSSVLKQQSSVLPSKANSIVDRIELAAISSMESMNDIVWSVNSQNDNLHKVIARIRAYASSLLEAKGIDLDIQTELGQVPIKIGMEQRKNIYLTTKEAISNAVRHADCSSVSLCFRFENGLIHVAISDDGTGFDTNNAADDPMNLGGNGLRNMRERVKQLGAELEVISEKGKGTRIQFECRPV